MSKRIEIDVRHVTRVEGHGNVRVRATDGTIEEVRWEIPEAPRFFEAMCRGRSQTVVSRICGICSVTHSLAVIKAVEAAFGTEVSPQTDKLRILTHYGEQIESHVLHVGYLVSPDLLGAKSVIPLASSHAEVVKTVIALHRLGNEIMETLAGRKTHPIRLKPGGFAKLPTERQLEQMRADLEASVPRLEQLAGVIAGLVGELPDFRRETEYIVRSTTARSAAVTWSRRSPWTTSRRWPTSTSHRTRPPSGLAGTAIPTSWVRWHAST